MKVVIVAKTRMRSGACVGAITFEGQSVRLIAPDQETSNHFNLEYAIGDAWELETAPPEIVKPPHVENVLVRDKRLMRRVELSRVVGFIEKMMPPATSTMCMTPWLEIFFSIRLVAKSTSILSLRRSRRNRYSAINAWIGRSPYS